MSVCICNVFFSKDFVKICFEEENQAETTDCEIEHSLKIVIKTLCQIKNIICSGTCSLQVLSYRSIITSNDFPYPKKKKKKRYTSKDISDKATKNVD